MNVLFELTKRNVKIFLRDKSAVFFSFLSVIIIIGLYVLFLGDMQVKGIEQEIGHVEGLKWLVNGWIMSGIVVVNTVTITLGALNTIIKDRESNVLDDLFSSPISRYKIVLSYIFSSWIVAIFLTIITFIVAEIFIINGGGHLLPIIDMIKALGIIIISVISSSAIMFFFMTFIKTISALSVLSTIIGTIIGFLGGIYIPMGVLSNGVQNVIKLFPPAHAVTIMRQLFLEQPMAIAFDGAPSKFITEYKETYGITMNAFGYETTYLSMVIYLMLTAIIFYILSAFRIKKMIKK
jgi:multidrug/hemolysin transport system permease protein